MEQQIRIWQSFNWKSISDRSKDLVIAAIIAFIGLFGSYIILGRSIRTENIDTKVGIASHSTSSNIFYSSGRPMEAPKASNEALLVIQGSFFANQVLMISYMNFKPDRKYMIDYGNGIRHLLKSASTYFKYQDPGIYYILYYEMIDNKWEIISSQSITIKS